MATQTGSIDMAAMAEAAKTANDYITDVTSAGIQVHPKGDATSYAAIDANGMSVVKESESVAHFGEDARVGVLSAFNTLIQAASFAIRYATDRLFNVSTDGLSTSVYMGGSTLPSGYKYTDNQLSTIYDYLQSGCTVSGHVVLDPDGSDTTWRLSDDGYGFLYDAVGDQIISPGLGEIEYLPSTGTWTIDPPLQPQSEIPGAPVSIDMGNVGIRAANKKLAIVAAGVAEGSGTTASGSNSHAEGSYTTASGTCSHAEGASTTATKAYSHTEGYNTTASGTSSHAEGSDTTASGISSHVEGAYTTASGDYSHAQNQGTIAGYPNQTVIGRYNDNGYSAFEIGNGTSNSSRSNAFAVDWDGYLYPTGEQMPDWVVAQGRSGIWTNRLWHSGVSECWGTYTASIAVNIASASYGGYRSDQITATAWPTGTFVAAPTVTATVQSGGGTWVNNVAGSDASAAKFFLSCGASMAAANRSVAIHAIGRWK